MGDFPSICQAAPAAPDLTKLPNRRLKEVHESDASNLQIYPTPLLERAAHSRNFLFEKISLTHKRKIKPAVL